MNAERAPNGWRRLAIGACLVAFLVAVYFVTYNGFAASRDEWFLFDATESMARRGDLRVNFEFDAYPPVRLADAQPPPADTEPLQPVLAAGLFLVAQALPGIGLAHTVWLFNVLVTALTAATLFAFGLALGYRGRVAALVALAFGIGTIAWPYSRTFFREPLFTWLSLLSVYFTLRLRQQLAGGKRPWLAGVGLALAFSGAVLSKEAALLILPAVIVEALPARLGRVRLTRGAIITLAGLGIAAILLALAVLNADTLFDIPQRYAFVKRLQQARGNLSDLSEGIKGYMFSPGRSMWLFSPVLLLGFLGWPRLARERQWRLILMPLVMTVSFAVGYAAIRGADQWHGGLGWGPRYLVPVTPFVALWLLPVAGALVKQSAAAWKRLGALAVLAISVAVQVLGVVVPIHRYYDVLTANDIIPWEDGAWNPRWSQFRVSLDLLGDFPADFAWRYATGDAWLLPVLCAALGIGALAGLAVWTRERAASPRSSLLTAAALVAATALTLGSGLLAIRRDPRYYGDFRPTRDLLAQLEAQLEPGDVIVLNDYTYSRFFMNYYKRSAPPVITLSKSPGERSSPDQNPEHESPYPDDLIEPANTLILSDLATRHARFWLVINSSPAIPWAVRPMEQFLTRHYFATDTIQASDVARAVAFSTTPAPPPTAPAWPDTFTSATFGDTLRLVGYDIPGGTTWERGQVLPVSLLWETVAPPPHDFTVGLFLTLDGALVAQRDSFPANHFEFTSTWQPGSLHRDNHGLPLSDSLAPGTYELWTALYWWETPANRLPVVNANGAPLGDHAVLATITIAP